MGTTGSGRSWTTERDKNVTKNEDGSVTVTKNKTKTLDNGKTVNVSKDRTYTKTDEGLSWDTNKTRTGPRGTSAMSGSGSAKKTSEGVSWNSTREGTGAKGRTWQSNTSGEKSKTENIKRNPDSYYSCNNFDICWSTIVKIIDEKLFFGFQNFQLHY